jgi:hypothetical protein
MTIIGRLSFNTISAPSPSSANVLVSLSPQCTCGQGPTDSHAQGIATGARLIAYPFVD